MVEYNSIRHNINKIVGDQPRFLNKVYNKVNNELGYLFNRRNTNNKSFNGYKGSSRIETVIGTCALATLIGILSWVGIIEHGKLKRIEKPLDTNLIEKVVNIYDLDATRSLDPNEVQKLLEDFKSREISNYSLEGFVEEHQQDLQQNSNAPH